MPDNTEYLFTQGTTLLGANRLPEALKAFEAAVKLAGTDKVSADNYESIAITLHYQGRDPEAVEQLSQGLRATNGEPSLFTAFWQHIVAKRIGTIPSQLEVHLNRELGREWPYPIGDMLLGRISPEKLIEAAGSEDKGIKRDQLCEAYFYIGQRHLWEGRPELARASFEKSVAQEIFPFAEYSYALQELGRVKAPRPEKRWWSF